MRDERGRFKKGFSGHTGGGKGVGHVRELARVHTQAAINTLVSIMMDETKREQARVAAAESLLDRAWGKPSQPIDHQGEAFSLILHLGGKPDDDRG